ncbi:MAG: peroxiredoxin-like family protein [Rhizomicrobium sp.]
METRLALREKLDALRVREPVWKARYDGLVQRLRGAGIGEGALKAGEACPEFVLANAEGVLVSSADLLARGPVVLSFYRGKWCPYCVTELEALRDAAPDIAALGATLVAVTAEDCGGALAVKRRRRLDFEILCDLENGLGLTFGLVFRVAPDFRGNYKSIDVDFPLIYGNDSWFLPVPATYVVGRDGIIKHAYVNPDFRERLDPSEILDVLKSLAPS